MLQTKAPATGLNTGIAFEQLRQLILSGDLGPGTDHLESELADRLGMSRTPVREALLRLEAQGLIVVRPRKGVRITSLSTSDVTEIFDILAELEGLAAAKAAAAGLTDDDLSPMTANIAAMQTALETDDREGWASADDQFHQVLIGLGGSTRLAQMANVLAGQAYRVRMTLLYIQPPAPEAARQHGRVRDAIRDGDVENAAAFQRAHRLAAKEAAILHMRRHRLSSI